MNEGQATGPLSEALRARARASPEALAFRFLLDGEEKQATLTYAALLARADAIAAALRARGAPGDRVLLIHSPGLDYLESFFGCLAAGMVAVPAHPPRLGAESRRAGAIAEGARIALALGSAGTRDRLAQEGDARLARVQWLVPEDTPRDAPPLPARVRAPHELAVLQHTSGSTSAPRGVMLSEEDLVANAQMIIARANITPADRAVAWLPPVHDMGLIGFVVAPIIAGVETTLLSPTAFLQRPLRWLRALSRFGATITGAPDFAFRLCAQRAPQLANGPAIDLSRLRVAFTGAERIRPETIERFTAAFAPHGFSRDALVPSYGLAEATLAVSAATPGEPPIVRAFSAAALRTGSVAREREGASIALVSSGRPLDGVAVRIVDPETRREVAPGRTGELWVQSPSVAGGYWNATVLSDEIFRARLAEGDEPHLRTGDLGFLDGGELFVTGRLKELLILRGVNHYPEDLEATSGAADERLRAGAAFAVEPAVGAERADEALVLAMELDRPPESLSADERAAVVRRIRRAIAEEHDLRVQDVVLLAPRALPRTASGKLQRTLARERYLAGDYASHRAAAEDAGAAASPEVLGAVLPIFASVLGLDAVGADDDFFALGGHSLLATQLAARVRETLGLELPLRAVFEAPTPRALAVALARCPPLEKDALAAPKSAAGAPLQLSFSQERMWYQQQLEPESSAYNVGGAIALDGPLDAPALEASLRAIVQRHDVLRSTYPIEAGVPRVRIAPALAVSLPPIDLTNEPDPEASAPALVAGFLALPFDLTRDALVRVRLYRLAPERHVLAVSLHHIVADGWSLGVLLDEALRGYQQRPGPPPRVGYFELAAWERNFWSGERLARGLAFWKTTLQGAPMLQLPTDHPRPLRRTSKGGFFQLPLEPALIASLRALAQETGSTLSLVMLAAFEVLLARTAGQTDLVIGTPVANRSQLAAEPLIGTLVNTLPLRFQVDPEASFLETLRALREASLAAWTHQAVPFERIVSELQVERSAAHSPLFQVMFDFQNWPMPARASGPLRMRPLVFSPGASQFDLSLFVLDTELGNSAGVAYSRELFEPETIERLFGRYLRILEHVAARPRTQVARIPLLSADERNRLVAQPINESPPPRQLIHRLFEAQARATPDAVAVVDSEFELTYRQLDRLANGLAIKLRERGAGPGERVAVLLDRSRHVVVALLAVLKTGAAYVPVDPRFPPERIGYLLDDCKPAVLLTRDRLRAKVSLPAGIPAVMVESSVAASSAGVSKWIAATASAATDAVAEARAKKLVSIDKPVDDAPAYVLYTSGSTGRPKGVVVGHFAVANFLRSMAREPGLAAADRILSVTSISFDIAGLEIFLPLVTGASVQIAPDDAVADGFQLVKLIDASPATVLQATPSTYRMLIDAGWRGRKTLRLLCGGEAISRDLAELLLERAGELWNLYGPTETTIWSTLQRVAHGRGPVPIGRAIDHTALYLLDPQGEPVPAGVAGELYIGGAGVALGYFEKPELTAQRFLPDPFRPSAGGPSRMYRTGDAARLLPDGALAYLGRLDQQIKIRGHRIEPGEIEQVLREHASVRDAAVIAREDRPGVVRLVGYVVAESSPTQSRAGPLLDELKALCQRRLPEHMVPALFVSLPKLPLTPNGKVDRKALPPPRELRAPDEPRIAPRDPVEKELAEVWREVLGTPAPGVRESFFRHGGDSLLAVRLVARIEQRLGVELPLALLAQEPTIEQLGNAIQKRRRESAALALAPPEQKLTHLVSLQPHGSRPPLICVHGAGGNVLNLPEVARALGPEQPFLALQADGVDGRTQQRPTIEAMAQAYLAEVRTAQPRGPYFLSGYCGGGLVAYEMAQQLLREGEEVGALILIDLRRPGSIPERHRLREWWRTLVLEDAMQLWRRARAKVRRDLFEVWRGMRVRYFLARRRTMPYELRDFWLTTSFLERAARYQLAPYPKKLTVLRAHDDPQSAPDVEQGWTPLAKGGLAAFDVPGNHETLMREPHVEVLAARVAAVLQDAGSEE